MPCRAPLSTMPNVYIKREPTSVQTAQPANERELDLPPVYQHPICSHELTAALRGEDDVNSIVQRVFLVRGKVESPLCDLSGGLNRDFQA
jgi:hypothetical protein